MKKIFTVLAVLILGAVCAMAQSSDYIKALNKYYQEDRQGAYSDFKKLIQKEPNNDAAYYYVALLSEDLDESEEMFKKAIEIAPDNYWYQYFLAMFYATTRREELTRNIFEDLTEKFPARTNIYYDLINIYIAQKDIDKALETLDKIETKSGKNEATVLTRFELLANSDKLEDAFKLLELGYEEVKTPRIACMLGDYYMKRYDDKTAMKFYDEALEMDSSNAEAAFAKANICYTLRQYDRYFEYMGHVLGNQSVPSESKAEIMSDMINSGQFAAAFTPQLDTLMNIMYGSNPTDSTICSLTGAYLYRRGYVDDALRVMQETADRYPDSFDAAFNHCLLLYYSEEWETLTQKASEALLRFPNRLQLLQIRSIAFYQKKEYDNALADNAKIVELAPKDSAYCLNAYSSMGDLYHLKGDTKKAYSCYDKALKINPDYAVVLNNYAYYLSEEVTALGTKIPAPNNKYLKKALKMSRKTIEQEPDNATYLDTYAWILHQTGMDIEAKAHFKHAMLYGGKESGVILGHYAEVLQTLGEKDLAEVYFKMAKNFDDK